MCEITLDDVISVLGEPTKKVGGEYVWMCPYCMDSHRDNFHYNERKKVAWCFASEEHSKQVYAEIMAKKDDNTYVRTISEPEWKPEIRYWYEDNIDNLWEYVWQANENLLNNKQYLKYIKKKHNLNEDTIREFMIGLDKDVDTNSLHIDNEIKDAFIFPIIAVDKNNKHNGLVGLELRSTVEKVIRRTKDTPKCAATFWMPEDAETLYVVEGLKDAYNLHQFLGKNNSYALICGSNGVSSTMQALEDMPLNKYKRVVLMLDRDEAGDKATKDILEKYPSFVDCREMIEPYKDITEYVIAKG